MTKETKTPRKKWEVPHTFLLIFIIIALCAVLTYIIPAGQYDMVETESGSSVVDPNSFHYVDSNPTGLYDFFNAVPTGLVSMASLIFFVFICGGSFGIINETKTLEIGINKLAHALNGKENIMIFAVMAIFSMLSALMGFNTECLIFIPLGVALARKCGYDSMTGTAMVLCGTMVGFSCGVSNPYTTAVAQSIVGLPTFSGMGFRIAMHIVMLILSAWYVLRYANRVKNDPSKSYCQDLEKQLAESGDVLELSEETRFSAKNILVLIVMALSFTIVIYNAIINKWSTTEMMPIFFAMGIFSGILGGMSGNEICKAWLAGARTMVFGALVIGMGRGVLIVMENGAIFHTIVRGLASFMSVLPPTLVAVTMFISNVIINFFVPSGSGQATLVMPIMGPLAQLTGVTQQTAVLAFQLGDGLTNTIIPTSSTTNAAIGIARIDFLQCIKFSIRLAAIQYAVAIVFIVAASLIGL